MHVTFSGLQDICISMLLSAFGCLKGCRVVYTFFQCWVLSGGTCRITTGLFPRRDLLVFQTALIPCVITKHRLIPNMPLALCEGTAEEKSGDGNGTTGLIDSCSVAVSKNIEDLLFLQPLVFCYTEANHRCDFTRLSWHWNLKCKDIPQTTLGELYGMGFWGDVHFIWWKSCIKFCKSS